MYRPYAVEPRYNSPEGVEIFGVSPILRAYCVDALLRLVSILFGMFILDDASPNNIDCNHPYAVNIV